MTLEVQNAEIINDYPYNCSDNNNHYSPDIGRVQVEKSKKKITGGTVFMRKLRLLLVSTIMCVAMFSYPVMASETEGQEAAPSGVTVETGSQDGEAWSTGNAINDILSSDRYQGAIESIEWLTTRTDSLFTMVITFTAFVIISAALLKNVMAGAYAAFPKFFDKVADAHQRVEAWNISGIKGYFTGGGYNNTSAGAVRDTLLAIIPNVKAFTDFEDGMVDPSRYFFRAIPQMVAVLIIGVFIYNGYYRDVALLVGSVGSEAFERVFWGLDPKSVLDRLTQTTGMPDFATDNATDTQGKLINTVTKQMYRAVLNKYTDVSSAAVKASLGSQIETWAINNFGINSELCSTFVSDQDATAKYKFSVEAPTLSQTNLQSTLMSSNDGNKATVRVCSPLSDIATFDSTKESGVTYYAIVYVNFSRIADDGTDGAGSDISYVAGDVSSTLNEMSQNKNKVQSSEVIDCNASGGVIYSPSGYKFYYSGSNAMAMSSDGIKIEAPSGRGYYTQLRYTGTKLDGADAISFADFYQQIRLEDEAGTTQYRFRITIVG